MCMIMCRGVYGELGVRRDGSQNTARGNHVPKSDGVEQSRHVFQAAVEASTKFTQISNSIMMYLVNTSSHVSFNK